MKKLNTEKPTSGKIKSFIVPEDLHAEILEAANTSGANIGQTHAALLRFGLDQLEAGRIKIVPPVKSEAVVKPRRRRRA